MVVGKEEVKAQPWFIKGLQLQFLNLPGLKIICQVQK
jgi:hypothetical protein